MDGMWVLSVQGHHGDIDAAARRGVVPTSNCQDNMTAPTLDRVLTTAEALPADEREMLEDLLRRRRVEAWRHETATEAKTAAKALRAGKLRPRPVAEVIARLRAGLANEPE